MESPLVCTIDAIPEDERRAHSTLTAELFGKLAQKRRDLPNGYAFRFGPDTLEALARFVSTERRCCPFLSFSISVPPAGESVWLEIVGPTGTRELLATDLPGIQALPR